MAKLSLKAVLSWTTAQIKNFIHTAGKRAQARLKTLAKAHGKGGSRENKQSYILDLYGTYNTKTKGLSKEALAMKAVEASEILSAKTSTVKGEIAAENKAREGFIARYPALKGKTEEEIDMIMKIVGKLRQAEREGKEKYKGSGDEMVFYATELSERVPDAEKDEITVDDVIKNYGEDSTNYHAYSAEHSHELMEFMDITSIHDLDDD